MSATPNDTQASRFTLDPVADLSDCDELRRRVQAPKKAELVSVRNLDALPNAVVKIIKSITKLKDDLFSRVRSVGVVVNRVKTAREVRQALADAEYTTHLVSGRMRPLDRADALERILPAVDPDNETETN